MVDYNGAMLENTIQSNTQRTDINGLDILPFFVRAGELLPPYWSRARDIELSRFWMKVDHVSSAFYMFSSKFASIPLRILPRDQGIKAHVKGAADLTANLNSISDFGRGWAMSLAVRAVIDFVSLDNGFFIEVIGDAPMVYDPRTGRRYRDTSKPRIGFFGLASLDSQFCLGRDSRVALADGSVMSIMDIVKTKYDGNVLSIGKNGQVEEKPIIGWYETQLNGRYWIRLSLANPAYTFGKAEGLWLTNDHQVMTHSGWKPADKLTTSDCIATSYRDLSREQRQVLAGSLLGDACLVRKYEHGYTGIRFCQSETQREWLEVKREALNNIGWIPLQTTHSRMRGKVNTQLAYVSLKNPTLNTWHDAWYNECGKKIIPRDIIEENLSPLMLATWYLDDGNLHHPGRARPSARFYTNSFNLNDVQWLSGKLTELGIKSYPKSLVNTTGKIEFIIYVTAQGAQVLFEAIAPYVPPSMQYKLSPEFRGQYQEWNVEQGGVFYDRVGLIKTGKNGGQLQAFCIDVADNHNFIAGSMVVHNCQRTTSPEYPVIYTDTDGTRYKLHHTRVIFASSMPSNRRRLHGVGFSALSRMINSAQHLYDISTMEQEELGSRPKRRMIIGKRGITASEIRNAFTEADSAMDNSGLQRYSKNVVIAPSTKATAANEVEMDVLDLYKPLDGMDKEKSITLGMFLIALALGIPPRWLWPATSTGATKADAMYQHVAGAGGGLGHLIILFQSLLGGDALSGVLGKPIGPEYEVVFDEQDDEQDAQSALIRKTRAETWGENLTNEVIDIRTARLQALEVGDISEQQFEDMELADGRTGDGQDILNLFYSTDEQLAPMLQMSVGDILNTEANTREDVLPTIEDKLIEIRATLANPTRPKEFDKAKVAFAALLALKKLYSQPTMTEEGLQQIGRNSAQTQTADPQTTPDSEPGNNPDNSQQNGTGQKRVLPADGNI